jgi:two-component system CheB/CheR fusion protein
VTQVRDRVAMQGDHVYVIPPNATLAVSDGDLVVSTAARVEERRAPVDIFFRTLAETTQSSVACVVLSGTGSDGASGLKRVKEHGGLTVAQDPNEAEHGDMPAQAMATGLVDYVLPVEQMPAAILGYHERLSRVHAEESLARLPSEQEALREVLVLLRVRTGHDFSNYKPATLMRRIARRMNLRALATMVDYARFMREQPDEGVALMKELLISVTNFFRDAEAFAGLEQRIVPRLFEGKHSPDQVRVWIAGCATGEEAYSIAMLLAECASTSLMPPSIQVFATDLDEHAVATARDAFYTDAEVGDVSDERLGRFFVHETGGYRVRRELREMVLFATHNVIKDPPFSHLDLISCRNLLIYLNRAVQERVMETFHFALRPGGYLFLGTSETADGRGLFVTVDSNTHVYESRPAGTRLATPPADPSGIALVQPGMRGPEPRALPKVSAVDLHLRLLEQYAPPSLVLTEMHEVVHVSEHAAAYLHVSAGEPSRDLARLIRPELRVDLIAALHQAARQRANVDVRGVRMPVGAEDAILTIGVKPVLRDDDPPRGFFLVLFQEEGRGPRLESGGVALTSPFDPANHLEEELARVRNQLRLTVEQYETQVEEAKASNEELQALNEELRSSAEELETSKEELQSVNEELTTVNQELKIKIEELALTNNDFRNFIDSTDIGTIFLDRLLRVKLSTRRAQDIFNLLPTDTGRRLTDITNTLLYDGLQEDARHVLDSLQTVEREVQTRAGRWHLMRILPYRTTDDRIEGVAITFLDITTRRQAELRARDEEERLRVLIDSAVDYAIFTMTGEGIIDSWNVGAQRMFGYAADEIVGKHSGTLFTQEDRAAGVPQEELRTAARDGRASDERYHLRRDGSRFYCSGVTMRLGESLGFAKIARDLTSQREAELALQEAHAGLEARVQQRTRALQDENQRRGAAQEHVLSLLRKLVTAQEDQRARIARDLHDQLGQQLTGLRLALERSRERAGTRGAVDDDLERALSLARQIDAEVDFLAWELRPAVLDDLGLVAALPRFLREWADHYGVAAEFRSAGFSAGQLSRESEVTFYRVAQEALNNVAKHAHASRVDVILEARDNSVVLVIEDDGVGFDPASQETMAKGIGLVGMQERASLSGATLQVESAPGSGTTVFLRSRIEQPAQGPLERQTREPAS